VAAPKAKQTKKKHIEAGGKEHPDVGRLCAAAKELLRVAATPLPTNGNVREAARRV
jgi:hypothetical protein